MCSYSVGLVYNNQKDYIPYHSLNSGVSYYIWVTGLTGVACVTDGDSVNINVPRKSVQPRETHPCLHCKLTIVAQNSHIMMTRYFCGRILEQN